MNDYDRKTFYMIILPADPTSLGDDATPTDLRAYADQLAAELGVEVEEDVEAQIHSVSCATVLGPYGDTLTTLRRRLYEIESGDEWIAVRARLTVSL